VTSGSVCPDFTGTDLDGQSWHLYELLAQGYTVVVDVSATWCSTCWVYHNSGALNDLYTAHGPDGTNDVRVLFVEGDVATTLADLNGTGTNTQGDWVSGTPYPIIDDSSIRELLDITYFPAIYTICQNRIITQTGQITATQHYEFISSNSCEATIPNDPSLIAVTAAGGNCGNTDVTLAVTLQNFGTEPLTSATIVVNGGVASDTTYWAGNLNTYAIEDISINVSTSGSASLDVLIVSPDGNTSNNMVNVVAGLANATTWWNVNLHTDCWPEEVSWEVVQNDNGTTVISSPVYAIADADVSSSFQLPSTGCYSFIMYDSDGDGMRGSQYTACGIDGSVLVWTDLGTVYTYGLDTPAYDFSQEQKSANAITVSVEETNAASGFRVYPNPSNGLVNLTFSLKNEAKVTIDVLNSVGEKVIARNIGSRVSGAYRMPLDLNELSAGIYLVSLNVDGVSTVTRITVTK
jgi:hypothetical protein